MVAPLGRRSGRKFSQVSNICLSLWTWKTVFVAKLGNTRISRVATSVSPWIFWDLEYIREVWQSEQDGDHIFRVKSRIGEIRKGVGNRSGSQDQSKVEKIKKARYAIGNVSMKDLSNKIKEFEENCQGTLCEKDPQTWTHFKLFSSSCVYRRVYDEMRWE